MNNCIITGGAGFVGSHLIKRLIRIGFDKIYIIDNLVRTNGLRNIQYYLDLYPEKVEFHHGDASWFDFSIFKDVVNMYHLAATRINRCVKYPYEGHQYIADSGFNVVNYCAKNNVKLYFASSASVYASPKRFPILESDPCIPPTLYGSSKLYTEHLMRNFNSMMGLDYTINRYFSVYGPKMDSTGVYTEVIFNWLNNIKKGKYEITVFGDPAQKVLDLVYVDDVISAIDISTTNNIGCDVFNVSTETGTTLEELIHVIEKVTNQKLKITRKEDTRNDIENKRVGSTEKLRSIGWKPKVPLEKGIFETYEWITIME